jgi:hypothetical protein
MSSIKKVLLLIGSPRAGRSVSNALGEYLVSQMAAPGVKQEKIFIQQALKKDPTGTILINAFADADIVLLAFPLYADSLPHPVIEAFELLSASSRENRQGQKSFAVLCNSGFPEAGQSRLALGMCRQFAKESGLAWKGGLAMGGGGALEGRDLDKAGGMARNIRKALQTAAAALAENRDVPAEAMNLMARPMMPTWLYLFMGNLGWRIRARRNGVGPKLCEKPYKTP